MEEMQYWEKYKMAHDGHICQRTETKFGGAQLDYLKNNLDKFRENLTSGLGGDAITRTCLQT